ncbi:MAG: MTH895/ArsE family thioredoxin-like protein [Fimbriimonadales bacterium]|nr:MTH895/ArsE family thioredoxin-like protein [Fimbriimonadales bacterium]
MKLQVLGTGCPRCHALFEAAQQANQTEGWGAELEKVEDLRRILEFGVMQTPALALDGRVLLAGRVPSAREIADLVTRARAELGGRSDG